MSFQPVLPFSGYAGWRFLARTLPAQTQAFRASAPVTRATDYFRGNIAKAKTPAALVGDRRLLEVALGAYGLSADIGAKAFVTRVLEGGTLASGALANKLADKRYAAFAADFGYGNLGSNTGLAGFADTVIARYESQGFQEAVGARDDDMRLALNLSAGIAEIKATTANPRAQWFSVMGNPPLRKVLERALGLPASIGAIDIDLQLKQFQARSQATFGTQVVGDFADPKLQERVVRLFLLRSDAQAVATTLSSVALQLLRR